MTWCPSDDSPPPATAAPKTGEEPHLFWRSLTSCTGKGSWCSPTPDNFQVTSAVTHSLARPRTSRTLCGPLCACHFAVGNVDAPQRQQRIPGLQQGLCNLLTVFSQQLEAFLFKRLPHAPVLKKEEKDPAWSMHMSQNPEVPGR